LDSSNNAYRTHVIRPAQVKDLLDDFVGRLVRVVAGATHARREPGFAELATSFSPQVES
jgi:hypothetical protein